MTVKTRLSLFISLLVGFMLVLNLGINDYFICKTLQKQYDRFTENVSVQTVEMFKAYWEGTNSALSAASNHLKLATRVAEQTFGETLPSEEQLKEVIEQTGVSELEVLERVQGSLIVRASMVAGRHGQQESIQSHWEQSKGTVGKGDTKGFFMDSVPRGTEALISGYYIENKSPFIIRAAVPLRGFGPEEAIQQVTQYEPQVLEIGIWEVDGEGEPKLVHGAGTYFAEDIGQGLLRKSGQAIAYAKVPDSVIVRSSYPFELEGTPYRLSLAVERIDIGILSRLHARNEMFSAVGIFIVLMIGTWIIIRATLKPLRSIVRKVGEVANGSFDPPLKTGRRDEIGELALQINVMSHNLKKHTGELKAASDENERIKEQLESIIENTVDSIVIIGLNCNLIKVNRSFCQMFGYKEEEVLFRGIKEFVDPENTCFTQEDLLGLMNGGTIPPREDVWKRRDGEYIKVSASLSALRSSSGEVWGFVSVLRDISTKSQMEELLRRSEKLTTVGQLAAGVAHEIRNPLTTLRGFLQLQQESGKLNLRHNDIMLAELDRINLIVSEFLILAKPQAARYEVKDVRFVLGDVISLLDSEGHLKNAIFHTRFIHEPCLISCEENQLKQVFINIIKNAIEAMPQGGNVYFDIERPSADSVTICITDEGVGIPEDIIPRIGDPFFTAKETGTGLGIMVSQRIIHSHKGTMHISSKLGEGTSITLVLPAFVEKTG
ncbi:two-component system, sporulation sensor kinase E [Paenibacillaceae bacterium GAS479]|nr:two-component system, sporulation sensor kinase E [Paenibacillaceae bacterium GAS479]